MINKVYIVLEDAHYNAHYDGTYVCGVYADERDAAEKVQRLKKKHLDGCEGYRTSFFYYAGWRVREPQETKGKKPEPQVVGAGGKEPQDTLATSQEPPDAGR